MRTRLERDERGGVTVWVQERPQSYVAPHDPGLLAFEYVEHLGIVLDLAGPPGTRLAVTHVGGAGLTLPRYVEHTRPGSPQIVLEPDTALTDAVRAALPLPRGHRIRVRPLDGRTGMAALADASADVVIVDAFEAGVVPGELTTIEFYADCLRVLRGNGLLGVNLTDAPDRRYLARVVGALHAAGAEVVVLATHDVRKGRRFGNYVLVAGPGPLPVAELRRRRAGAAAASGLWDSARVGALARSARPASDADPAHGPVPPDPGAWRIQ